MKPFSSSKAALFFERLAAENPSPQTELFYTNPYTLLVAVVLSAQSTDTGVNKATASLFQAVSSPQDMLALGEEKLKEAIRTIGLYPTKAKHIMELSRQLMALHGGNVPQTREALEKLPGVGRKTANVVLNTCYQQPAIAVDTHIFRVSNRTGLAPGKTPLAVEKGLEAVIPSKWKLGAHHWLVLHGRYVCKARKPLCAQCLVQDLCAYARAAAVKLPPKKPD
jgi:endonuclease III